LSSIIFGIAESAVDLLKTESEKTINIGEMLAVALLLFFAKIVITTVD